MIKTLKVGDVGKLKNLDDFLNGLSCKIVDIDEQQDVLVVVTTECKGAQPSGVIYEINRYEFDKNGN